MGVNPTQPRPVAGYDARTTAAVNSVLVEIGQILGSFRDKFVVVGGAVPWLQIKEADMPHVGTIDLDLSLDAAALKEGGYVGLIEALMERDYQQREGLRRFQLVRRVSVTDGGDPVDIIIDFLMPRDIELKRNKPPLIDDFAVQRADGADLALRFNEMMTVTGSMPAGGENTVQLAVCSIPAFLAMKGYAVAGRDKKKDAYDIYYCVKNYPHGTEALAKDCGPVLDCPSGETGFRHIVSKFSQSDGYGPTSVRRFAEEAGILEERTAAQWQQDAFFLVNELLRALGLVDEGQSSR